MADDLNTFPLILTIREDGALTTTVDGIERYISAAAGRSGAAFESAGRRADNAFRLNDAKRSVDTFAKSIDAFQTRAAQRNADPLGIRASLAGLSSAPFQKIANEQLAAENALAQQRARASAERVASISREFEAAMGAIRQEQAARTAAFAQAEREGQALVALDQQRAAEMARTVAGPQVQPAVYYDPRGAAQAATSARAQATALNEVARAAETVAVATGAATAADRAFAATARDVANAAAVEANRLEQVAETQSRVAAVITASGSKAVQSSDLVTASVRSNRLATLQASQQFQDFFIQIQGGQNPLVAFSQQASQLAFVMANTGGEAGKFARFISGGWGTLILGGLSILTLLTSGLFDNKDAHKGAGDGARYLADQQAELAKFIDQTTGRIKEQNQALIQNQAIEKQQDAERLAKQYQTQRRGLINSRGNGQILAAEGGFTSTVGANDPRVTAALTRYANGGNTGSLSTELRQIGEADPKIRGVTNGLISMAAALTETARQAQAAKAASKVLLGDTSEKTRRVAFGDFSPPTTDTSKLRADAATAAIDQGTSALRAASARRRSALAQLDKDFNVKGGVVSEAQAPAYQARATAIEAQYNREKEAAEKANKDRSAAAATARRVAGEHRQELFADAKAIGDGTDAVKAANSIYDAEITRLRNQLREGIITDDTARTAAVRARQVRNAAVEAAQGAKSLDDALQRIGQEFDGDSRFVNRIEKAQAAVTEALKRIDSITGTAKIGDHEYTQDDLLAKQTNLREAYLRPIADANRQLREQQQIDAAILAGNEDQADFLRLKFSILQQYGDLNAQERAKLEALLDPLQAAITAEKDRNAEIEKRNLLIDTQANAARRVQDAFTNFFQNPFGKGGLSGLADALTKSRQQQIAEQLSIKLFGGDLGSQVHDALTRNNGPTVEAANDLKESARALTDAAGRLVAPANDNPSIAQIGTTPSAFGNIRGILGPIASLVDARPDDIVVTGRREQQDQPVYSVAANINKFGTGLIDLGDVQKKQLFQTRAQTVALSLAAQAIGGKGGAAINALLNADQSNSLGKTIAKELGGSGKLGFAGGGLAGAAGGAISGLGIGGSVASLYDLLGVKGAGTGSAIGGALGGAAFGPLGALGGSVIGGLIGSLFYKAPRGQAGISVDGSGKIGVGGVSGTSAQIRDQAGSLAGSVASGLQSIADQLGGLVTGSSNVKIGLNNGNIHVNAVGGQIGKKGSGDVNFGSDQAAAISFAIQDALNDGIISGIRASTKRLIAAGGDLDRQLQKAVSFEGIFVELKRYQNPVGAAIDELDKQFDNLRSIAREAGATSEENAQLEQLYAFKRADAVKQAQEQLTGQLQSLLDNLRYKGDSGLSLRTREAAAAAAFNPLAATIRSGGVVDQGAFTDAAQSYIDIERQLYGSTQAYFQKLAEITNLTSQAINNAGGASNVTPITAAVQQAAQTAAAAAIASTGGSFTIPQDRAAMFTTGQFTDAVAAAFAVATPAQAAAIAPSIDIGQIVSTLQEQTSQINARLDLLTNVTSKVGGKFNLDVTNYSLPAVQALRNA